jgi:hypothetical protein
MSVYSRKILKSTRELGAIIEKVARMEEGSEMKRCATAGDRILIVTNFRPQNPFVEALGRRFPNLRTFVFWILRAKEQEIFLSAI